MGAPVVVADMLSKAFGGRHLFDGAVFQVEAGDKVGVVGPNGAGKTTLLRILAGRASADGGHLKVRDGLRVHWFDQHPDIAKDATVRDLLAARLPTPVHLAEEHAALGSRIADPALYEEPGYEEVLARFAEVEQEIKRATEPPADAWDTALVRAMGFGERDLDLPAKSLSGGEKTRLLLARTLDAARDGDLLVLDEPTNHLDVDTIEWLEDWIAAFSGTVLVVAHDRAFLDNTTTKILEVSGGRVTVWPGNYSDYVALRDQQHAEAARAHEKAVREYEKTKETVLQFRKQKRFDGQYGSRMKMLERYKETIDRTPDPVLAKYGFSLGFEAMEKSSNEVLRATGLKKRYGDRMVLDDAEFEVGKGDRIGVVGRNGAGKTTLIRIVTGRERPDAGTVRAAPAVKGSLLSQEQEDLDPARTLKAEVLDVRPTLDDDAVKALLGRFRFKPESDMLRTVSTLSGGERARMSLLKAVLKPSNLLVLDEPTNHLDIDAREVVAKALNAYQGTLLVVSHDRWLLDTVTGKTAVVRGGDVEIFPGSYTESRPMHRKDPAGGGGPKVPRGQRYRVVKKFTDWTTETRYRVDDEVRFTDEDVRDNHSVRNAVKLGWLTPLD